MKEVSAATRVAYAKFKTKMLLSHIKEIEDSEPATPAENPKHGSKASKAQSMRVQKRASVVKQQKLAQGQAATRAGKVLPKGISMDPGPIVLPQSGEPATSTTIAGAGTGSATPILTAIQKEILKQKESRESSVKKKTVSIASSPAKGEKADGSPAEKEIEGKVDDKGDKGKEHPHSTDKSETEMSGAKTEYTVVQIETRPPDSGSEDTSKSPAPSEGKETSDAKEEAVASSSTAARKMSTPRQDSDDEEIAAITSKPDDGGKRKASTSSATRSTPPPPVRSPSPTGKSAVTGQTRTGWI